MPISRTVSTSCLCHGVSCRVVSCRFAGLGDRPAGNRARQHAGQAPQYTYGHKRVSVRTYVLGVAGQGLHGALRNLGQLLQQDLGGLLRLRGELRDDVLLELPPLMLLLSLLLAPLLGSW